LSHEVLAAIQGPRGDLFGVPTAGFEARGVYTTAGQIPFHTKCEPTQGGLLSCVTTTSETKELILYGMSGRLRIAEESFVGVRVRIILSTAPKLQVAPDLSSYTIYAAYRVLPGNAQGNYVDECKRRDQRFDIPGYGSAEVYDCRERVFAYLKREQLYVDGKWLGLGSSADHVKVEDFRLIK
jgi:hypothetical protein